MARLEGPLFGTTAYGHIGKTVVYDRMKGINTLRTYRTGKDKETNPRKVIREINGLIRGSWQNASEELKEEFKNMIGTKKMHTYNIFYINFFRWIFDARCDDSYCGIGTCST